MTGKSCLCFCHHILCLIGTHIEKERLLSQMGFGCQLDLPFRQFGILGPFEFDKTFYKLIYVLNMLPAQRLSQLDFAGKCRGKVFFSHFFPSAPHQSSIMSIRGGRLRHFLAFLGQHIFCFVLLIKHLFSHNEQRQAAVRSGEKIYPWGGWGWNTSLIPALA